jgi:hypothetical protein
MPKEAFTMAWMKYYVRRASSACFPAFMTVLLMALVACNGDKLRGSSIPSNDGRTYLIVADNNGGDCGSIKVDGSTWSHPIGEAGLTQLGHDT